MPHFYQLVDQGKIISSVRAKNALTDEEVLKFCCEIDDIDCDLARTIMEVLELSPTEAKLFPCWDDFENFEEECHRCLRQTNQ